MSFSSRLPKLWALVITATAGLVGCPTSTVAPPDAPVGLDAPSADAPATDDATTSPDAPTALDAGGGTDSGGGADAPSTASGDCDTDADCPGGTCVELVPGGFRVCRTQPVEETTCGMPGIDECCTTADCAPGETCFLGPIVETCGGPTRLPFNECASDLCATDADCGADRICAPAGTFAPVAVCVSGSCHHDADCTAEAGGRCVVARDPCCNIAVGLLCAYASDGCRSSADCTTGYCELDGTRARCVGGPGPFCPL